MENRLRDIAVVIPAFEPGAALPGLLGALRRLGFRHIVLVDDGSRPNMRPHSGRHSRNTAASSCATRQTSARGAR